MKRGAPTVDSIGPAVQPGDVAATRPELDRIKIARLNGRMVVLVGLDAPFTLDKLAAATDRVADLCRKYGIQPAHGAILPRTLKDPGPRFPFGAFVDSVRMAVEAA